MSSTYRVLVPFDLPDADPFPSVLLDALATTEAVAFGHYELPEQTPPGAAREQFEGDAREELVNLVAPLKDAGVPVRTRLVFSTARRKAIDRVARTYDCDAVLTTGWVESLDRLFVALGGQPERDRTLSFVAGLLTSTDVSITLFHTSEEELTDATDQLIERGVDPNRIYQQLSESTSTGQRVVEPEDECDLLVVGEPDSSRERKILPTGSAEATVDTDGPAFIIRNHNQS